MELLTPEQVEIIARQRVFIEMRWGEQVAGDADYGHQVNEDVVISHIRPNTTNVNDVVILTSWINKKTGEVNHDTYTK